MAKRQLGFVIPLSLAVALNAVTPDPGGADAIGCVIWSTTTASLLRWSGTAWVAVDTTGGGFAPAMTMMTATQSSTIVAAANITQLASAMVANGTYSVDAFVTFQSAATATGLALGFTSPSGCRPMVTVNVPLVSVAAASSLRITFPNAAAIITGLVIGTGATAINSNHTAYISGFIKNGATAGNFQLQFASEVAGSAITLQIGSEMILTQLA